MRRWLRNLLRLAITVITVAGAFKPVSADTQTLPPGHYTGLLTIKQMNGCEEFVFGNFRPSGDAIVEAFLTVEDKSSRLVLDEEVGNTRAADYFETVAGT